MYARNVSFIWCTVNLCMCFLCEKLCEFLGDNLLCQVIHVRNDLYKCSPGNVGKCELCEKPWDLLRANCILPGNIINNYFV